LWSLFKASDVFVSPSSHDGTPNTLLESMACGCFPVVGNIESMQEWIEDGKNGSLVDPLSPAELGEAILKALADENLRSNAAQHNLTLLAHRADKRATLPFINQFYSKFIAK
jgi:glycosyltransferase involved in cell wall biosynthesis